MLNLNAWIMQMMSGVLNFETSSTASVFIGVAQSVMTAVGIVLVLMFTSRAAQSLEYGQVVPMGGYVKIFFQVGLCFAVIRFWSSAAPGVGVPLGTLIPNTLLGLAQVIGWTGAQDIAANLVTWAGMEMPGTGFSLGAIWWLLGILLQLICNIALAIVLVIPMVIVAGLVIIGPIFVPMWIVPELTGVSRGYLRSLISYSLVPVVSASFMRIIAQTLLPSVGQLSGAVTSVETALPQIFMLCIALVVAVAAMFASIRIANHVASGSSGTGSGWLSSGLMAIKGLL